MCSGSLMGEGKQERVSVRIERLRPSTQSYLLLCRTFRKEGIVGFLAGMPVDNMTHRNRVFIFGWS